MALPRRKHIAEVPSVAMGDIAFLLLIFFVILARARDDSHIQWVPATGADLSKPATMRVSVSIDRDNVTYLNGQKISHEQLGPALWNPEGLKDKGLLYNVPAGKRTVLLKIHKDATALFFEPVIEAVSGAGGELHHVLEDTKK
ncbi:MAG: biopolymer transporter ExbD [Pedosphaera sp.]|nr:biopolymer transporter ExbD [Pedosphaera sp.]MSU42417.1 biopolymer transporter ExbD [Pedosphaera sp.]